MIYGNDIYNGADIYNGGGGGGGGGSENPDGSIKKFALLNKNTSHFLEIPGTFQTKYKYNFSCLGWYGGLFGLIVPGSQAYYNRTLLGFRGTDYTAEGRPWGLSGNYSLTGYSIGALNEFKITDNGNLIFSLNSNGVEVFSDNVGGYGNGTSQTLNIFRCYDGQACGVGAFLSFEIKDENDDAIIYKFTPAEKEGVAGVYEEVTNTFYGETYHDNTIVCI